MSMSIITNIVASKRKEVIGDSRNMHGVPFSLGHGTAQYFSCGPWIGGEKKEDDKSTGNCTILHLSEVSTDKETQCNIVHSPS
jgi:hypothetical protein